MSAPSPMVSVVVPSFNHAAHVDEALRSVEAQDYEHLELIVVDDASSDGTAEIARDLLGGEELREHFSGRVQWVSNEENRGAHATIDRALKMAGGTLIAILNSDDRYHPERISRLVEAVLEKGTLLAFSQVAFIDEDGDALESASGEAFRLHGHQARIDRFPSLGFAAMCSNVALSTGNLVFHRELWKTVGGFDALRYCHDWDFLLKSVAVCEPVFVREPLYDYRIHGGNTFRALDDVAEKETRAVLTRYFETVRGGRVENHLAPTPENWPGVFEYVMTRQGFWRYW